jgi:hypothetical protein
MTAAPIPSVGDVKRRFKELADVEDSEVAFCIEQAQDTVDDSLGDRQTLATIYLAAHYIMVSKSRAESASGQMVASETIGRMTTRYVSPQAPSDKEPSDLPTTPYGVFYLELLRRTFGTGVLVV